MDGSQAESRTQSLLVASGLASSHVPLAASKVCVLVERHYRLTGSLRAVATEKDDTFTLSTESAEYLVKVSPPSEPLDVVALQTAAMRYLEQTSPELPIQRVRLTSSGEDHVLAEGIGDGVRVLRVFDFVVGSVWAETIPTSDQLMGVGAMLGRVDMALEGFSHRADQRPLIWNLRYFHELSELLDSAGSRGQRSLASRVFALFGQTVVPMLDTLRTQVIHGDYSPYNVVVADRDLDCVTGVIDFGDTMRTALIFDPAVSVANLLGYQADRPWEAASTFVAGYQQTRPLTESEVPLLPVAALARLTLRALIANWRAERFPERREYLQAHAAHDWENIERSMAIPLPEIIDGFRRGAGNSQPAGRSGPGRVVK